jgi:membrane fusion protein, multidrug efflux system
MALDEDRVAEVVGRNAGDNAPAVRQPSRPANRPVVPVGAPPPRSAPVRRRPVKRLVLVALLLAAAGYGGQLGYRWWTEGRFMVRTDDAYVQGDITLLAAHAEGYVASVEVINNQEVRAGDVIARLDDGDYRLAREAAQNRLATQDSAIARIGRQIEAGQSGVARAQAALEAAHADVDHANAEYERQSKLVRSDFTSQSRMDEATWDRARSQAAIRSAEAALQAERANVDVLRAEQAEAERVAGELRTAVAQAERNLAFTVVRAPVDGVIGNKAVQVGSYVKADTRLAALVPLDSVHVDANFKETQLTHLRPGQQVRLAVDAFPEHGIIGTIQSIAPAAGSVFSLLPPENATGNFTKIVQRVPVRIAVDPEALRLGLLRPGLSVVVDVDTRTGPGQPAMAER